jgi:hypothetical protein
MSLTFKNLVKPLHAFVRYHQNIDSVEVLCLATARYKADDTSQAAVSFTTIYGIREYEAFATLQGSFMDQFPVSEGPIGHNPHSSVSNWATFVDSNSIQLFASRSLDDGSSTVRIPTELYRAHVPVERFEVILEWKIQNRTLTLEKGGEVLIEIPISRLEECIREGRRAAQPSNRPNRCCSAS